MFENCHFENRSSVASVLAGLLLVMAEKVVADRARHSQSNLVAHACRGLKTYICHSVNSLRSSFHKNIRYKWMNILPLSLFQHVHKPYLVAVWNLYSKMIKSFQVIRKKHRLYLTNSLFNHPCNTCIPSISHFSVLWDFKG